MCERNETYVGIGFSSNECTASAVRSALEQAVVQAKNPKITLVLGTEGYNPQEILYWSREITGNSLLVGAWVPGVIFKSQVYTNGLLACAISGESINGVTHLEKCVSALPFKAGEKAGRALLEKGGDIPGTVIIFTDGSCANISDFLRGLYHAMGPDYDYIGGGSGSNLYSDRTFQFTDEGISSESVAIAVLRGLKFSVALDHGWKPAGEPLTITRAEGRRVYEIDGIPALERYTALVGDCARKGFAYYGMRYPLGLPAAGGKFIIRDPLKAIDEDGSILFVTEIPENTIAMLMEGDTESLVAAAGRAVQNALNIPAVPKVFLLFDCVSRYLLLGDSYSKEISEITGHIGASIPFAGMLSFGEISSVSGTPLFYNKTVVAAVGC